MPSSHDRRHEPAYVDDLEAGRPRYPPPPREHVRRYADDLGPDDARPRRRRSYRDPKPYPDSDEGSPPPRRPRRQATRPVSGEESPPPRPRRREIRPISDDESPPPRPRRRDSRADPPPDSRLDPRARPEPRPRPRKDEYEDDYPPPRRHADRPRRPRDDDYYSDSRHDRPRRDPYYDERGSKDRYRDYRPPHDPYDDRAPRRRDNRYDGLEPRRGKSSRRDAEWQQQALGYFKQYALPVIKKEGTKFVSRQLGDIMAKQGKR